MNSHLERFGLIWLDANVHAEEIQFAQQKLCDVINYLEKFQKVDECRQYIEERPKDDRLVLIVSVEFAQEIVPLIHNLCQVSSIYVYCKNKKGDEQWTHNFIKVRCLYQHVFNSINVVVLGEDCYH